jgi:hypothetical protein
MRPGVLAAKLLPALAIAVLAVEISFRMAGAFVTWKRGTPVASTGDVIILCVGDSHTWGRSKGYPWRLSQLLAERPERYRVVNFGVPGTNTAQLRNRFLGYLDRYQPRLVVLWSGINNNYNRAETEAWEDVGVERASWGRKLLDSSRALRFIRLWRNQVELNRYMDRAGAYVLPDTARPEEGGGQRRHLLGPEHIFRTVRGDMLPPEQVVRVTELDLRWIIERAHERDIPVVVINYGLPGGWFEAAEKGILAAARTTGTILVDSLEAAARLSDRYIAQGKEVPRLYNKSAHPTQLLYDEIGDLVLQKIDAHGLLPGSGPRCSSDADEKGVCYRQWPYEEMIRAVPADSSMGRLLVAAEHCKSSEANAVLRRNSYGLSYSSKYTLEIRELSDRKCTVYFRLDEVTPEIGGARNEQGLNRDQLRQLREAYARVRVRLAAEEGKEGTCEFLSAETRSLLALWQAGKTLLKRHAECTGPLFEARPGLFRSEVSRTSE